jgi:hypothetical protein
MTTSIALDLPTWTGPAWATEHTEAEAGIRWTRRATTAVNDCPEPSTPEGEPVNVEVAGYDFLQVVGSAVLLDRAPVQFFVDGVLLDLNGARNLIAALTELVEAVEEGQR